MRSTFRTVWWVALGACVVVAGYATLVTVPRTSAAASSTWSWRNVAAIACPSVTACVAVGNHGIVVTTSDGGHRWVKRPTGIAMDLGSVTCPSRVTCYALGSDEPVPSPTSRPGSSIIRSADGGRTWRESTARLPTSRAEILASLACPSPSICLASGYDATTGESAPFLRTTDSGRTWRAVHISGLHGYVAVTCATVTVCYAGVSLNGNSSLARSEDSGKTWTVHGLTSPQGLTRPELENRTMACTAANTCFATALDCGSFACSVGDIFVTRDGARIWKQLYYGSIGGIVCPSATTCYARAVRSVLRTINSGKTWSAHRLSSQEFDLACPNPTTCYTLTGVAVLKTSDGFGHTR